MRLWGGGVALWLALGQVMVASNGARAQTAHDQPAGMADVVRLKDGTMVRGTIAELVPNDKVVLVTVTGETRSYPMADVAYAGAVANMPSAAPEPAPQPASEPAAASTARPASLAGGDRGEARPFLTVHAGEARLRLLTRGDDTLTYHLKTGTATATAWNGSSAVAIQANSFTEICTAPCDASLPNGSHTFGVSKDDGAVILADRVHVDGPTTLHATYSDRSGVRIGGWLLMLGGFGVGTALMVADISGEGHGLGTGFYAGTAVMGVGALVGAIMAMTGDGATVEAR